MEHHSHYSTLRSRAQPYAYASPSSPWTKASQLLGIGKARGSPLSTNSSSLSYYTANSSPLSQLTAISTSTQSSNLSYPYSVTSINSYKSRKNVLYPRRVHPLPVAVPLEPSTSPDALLIWQVWFLSTILLPCTETRLVPAGRVLLHALEPHNDFSQHIPVLADEQTRYCSELFIALAHEVVLKDAICARALEGPCRRLHETFRDILFNPVALSKKASIAAPTAGDLAIPAWYGALNATNIKLAAAKNKVLRESQAQPQFLVSAGPTIRQFRKKLDQKLAQIQAQLNNFKQPEALLSPSAPAISTIEEVSEVDGGESFAKSYAWSHSTLSHSHSGKRSLPRRILRRLIPSSIQLPFVKEV
ncbi:hypothetical protein EI94DRAFT_1732492 [Lactarius quietus]|nr:hypothetical protein EI94DRAFT_1732492 [Lactarius quietus]